MKRPNFIGIQGHMIPFFVLMIRPISFNSQTDRQQHGEHNSSLQLSHRHRQSNLSADLRGKTHQRSDLSPHKEDSFPSESVLIRNELKMGLRFIERREGFLKKD